MIIRYYCGRCGFLWGQHNLRKGRICPTCRRPTTRNIFSKNGWLRKLEEFRGEGEHNLHVFSKKKAEDLTPQPIED